MKTCAVIIPAYDCTEYIYECVASVVEQQPIGWWIYDIRIGVDGCKKTSDYLLINGVSHYYHRENVGAYVMRNSLIMMRPADMYACFDADDVMRPDYLKKSLRGNHNIVMTGKVNCNQNLVAYYDKPVFESGGAMTFSQKVWNDVGGFQSYKCAGDTDFMLRVRMAGYTIKNICEPLYLRRIHKKSLTQNAPTRYRSEYRKKVWAEMCVGRNKGIIKIKPEIVTLEEKKP